MDLASNLKRATERFYERLKNENGFYRSVFQGDVKLDTIAYFLESIRHLVSHTPKQLLLALKEAEKRGYKELAQIYRVKLKEETGHDQWAVDDLNAIAVLSPDLKKPTHIAPAIEEMIRRNESNIKKDPYHYLVHIFFAEYFTVCDGPDFMAALEKIGIKPHMMSVVDNHVSLDVEHVQEWEDIIGQLVDSSSHGKTFLTLLQESFEVYERFCFELERYDHAA